jgi:RHS repeat-associated protein
VERDRDANGQSSDGLEERLYAQQDANYNITALVDANGTVVERYVEDPYGQVMVLTANWADRGVSLFAWLYLHQGGRFDVTSGLYHFRYRDYSPTLGRWVRVDPLEFAAGDVNLYRVSNNNTPNLTDPLGLGVADWFKSKLSEALDNTKHQLQPLQWEAKHDFSILGRWKFGFKFGIISRVTGLRCPTCVSITVYGSLYASGEFQSPIPFVSLVIEPSGAISGKLECCDRPTQNPRWEVQLGAWFCRGDVLATVGVKLGVRAGVNLTGAKVYGEGGGFIGGSWSLRRGGEFNVQVYLYIGATIEIGFSYWKVSRKWEYRYGSTVPI